MIEAIDPEWKGVCHIYNGHRTGGKIIYRQQDIIDPAQMKKLIVDDKFVGRYY